MRIPWLLVIAVVVLGLAALFVTTMTRVARLPARDQSTLVVTPVQEARAAAKLEPVPSAPPPAPTAPIAPTAAEPAAPATAIVSSPSDAAPSGGDAAAPATAPPTATAAVSATRQDAPQVLVSPPPALAAAKSLERAAPAPPLTTVAPVVATPPTPQNNARPAEKAVPRDVPRNPAPVLLTNADAQVARCRALRDYLRDLEAEAARNPDPGRRQWLAEQRSIARERQSEVGC